MDIQYIQNRTNWCWAVACRMVGEQFKRNNPDFVFSILCDEGKEAGEVNEFEYRNGIRTNSLEGLRMDVVKRDGDGFLMDAWQCAIVLNANMERCGYDSNCPGDDEVKERGIKYVVTGKCDTNLIQTVSLGFYDSEESLLAHCREQIYSVFEQGGYMIGNAVLYPSQICHSFVLLDWTSDNRILVYDPWNGNFDFRPVDDVFYKGISSELGSGVVKWVQYIA